MVYVDILWCFLSGLWWFSLVRLSSEWMMMKKPRSIHCPAWLETAWFEYGLRHDSWSKFHSDIQDSDQPDINRSWTRKLINWMVCNWWCQYVLWTGESIGASKPFNEYLRFNEAPLHHCGSIYQRTKGDKNQNADWNRNELTYKIRIANPEASALPWKI
jgi:hypothetical protein